MAYLKVQNECEFVLHVESRKYKNKWKHERPREWNL